jgi:hypothetical protein
VGNPRDKVVILVTDGLETCGGDVRAAAAELTRLGFKVEFYVVGFDVLAHEMEALREVARAGGGKYLNAQDAAQLNQVFETLHQEIVVRAGPVERKRIVVQGTGPGLLRLVGAKAEGVGDFHVAAFRREDTNIDLPPPANGSEAGFTADEFWGLGARILTVARQSAAERAGLRPGDLVVQVDEIPVETARQLNEVLLQEVSDRDRLRHMRVARFQPAQSAQLSSSEPQTVELPAGVYTLLAVDRAPGLLSDQAEQVGAWLLLDRGLPAFLTPLVWAMRIEPGQTREVALNVGLQLVREKTRHDDEFRVVEVRSGTEIRLLRPGESLHWIPRRAALLRNAARTRGTLYDPVEAEEHLALVYRRRRSRI